MSKEKMIDSINFAQIPFFHGLNKNNLEKLKAKLEILNFKAGEIIFNEGEIGDCMYIVIDGNVKVFITDEKGSSHEVARLGKNESFGEIALLTGAPRSASIQAILDSTVIRLSKKQFDDLVKINRFLAVHFAALLSKRLASTKHEVYEPKLSPKEVHIRMTQAGVSKAYLKVWQLFFFSLLAGIYISIGGHIFLVALEQGMGKIVGGAVFSLGLILVVIAEAELFTGNIVMMVGLLSSLYHFKKVLKNLLTVYYGNLVGSLAFALLIFQTGLFGTESQVSTLGQVAIKVADYKLALSFMECFIRGIFCNMLVLLAIIMSIFAKDIISKIFCCLLPVMVFVASGFEHCIANMYLIPIGLLTKGVPLLKQYIIFKNIIPVTLGNIVGGMFIIFIHPARIKKIMNRLSKIQLTINVTKVVREIFHKIKKAKGGSE